MCPNFVDLNFTFPPGSSLFFSFRSVFIILSSSFRFISIFVLHKNVYIIRYCFSGPWSESDSRQTKDLEDECDAMGTSLVNELACSAFIFQQAKLRYYRYKEMGITLDQLAATIFPLRDIHSSHVKSLADWMRSLAFYYRNGVLTVTWSAECSLTDSSMRGCNLRKR